MTARATAPVTARGGGRDRRSGPLSLAEVLRSRPLRLSRVPVSPGSELPVTGIRLAAAAEDVRRAKPGEIVVLHGPAARAAWSVEIAMRHAWERGTRCLVIPAGSIPESPAVRLAEHLGLVVAFTGEDPAAVALEIAGVLAAPDAERARAVNRCALRLAGARTVEDVVAVLADELPGVRLEVEGPATAPGDPDRLAVLGSADAELAGLNVLAVGSAGSGVPVEVVAQALALARAPLLAARITGRTGVARRAAAEQAALGRLLRHGADAPLRSAARRLGWALDGEHVAVVLRPDLPDTDPAAAGDALRWAWTSPGRSRGPRGLPAPVALPGEPCCWVLWCTTGADPEPGADGSADDGTRDDGTRDDGTGDDGTGDDGTRDDGIGDDVDGEVGDPDLDPVSAVAARVRGALGGLAVGFGVVAGVGSSAPGPDGLVRSIRQAALASAAAQSRVDPRPSSVDGRPATEPAADVPDPVVVVRHDELSGVAALAAALSSGRPDVVAELVAASLAAVPGADDAPALLATVAAYLDCGGSSSSAAARLGIHRNTVLARVDRARRLGLALDDPELRLTIHLSARLAVARRPLTGTPLG